MLLAAALATALFPTSAAPQDAYPVWSPDARYIAFHREEPPGFASHDDAFVVPSGRGTARRIGRGSVTAWRPDGGALALVYGGSTRLVSPSGAVLARVPGAVFGWSPDGRELGYRLGSRIFVADAGGQNGSAVASFGLGASWDQGPVWSPDGTRIAFTSVDVGGMTTSLEIVNADGTGLHTVFQGPNQNVNPSWAPIGWPGGERLAFESNGTGSFRIWTVAGDGSDLRPLMVHDFGNDRLPVWNRSGTHIAFISDRQGRQGGATASQYALYTIAPDGTDFQKLADDVHPVSPVENSPTGALIAFAAGRECQRWGIYTMRLSRGVRQHRRTNDCHIVGTPRADLLRGTPYLDIIRGLGGNDRISGGNGHDQIEGGSGNDVLAGGRYGDILVGGRGRDRISGGLGPDLIEVRDGERDVVSCGKGADSVFADRLDRVANDCEEVFRPRS